MKDVSTARYDELKAQALQARCIITDAHMSDIVHIAFNSVSDQPTATLYTMDGILDKIDAKTAKAALEVADRAGKLLERHGWQVGY